MPQPLTRMKAQLTALAMEKQALLEDIALGNSARGDRLAAIEQEEIRLILALDTLETQYGQEPQLTEALLACRRDISRQAEISDLQTALIAVQQGNPLPRAGRRRPHRGDGDCRLDRRAALLANER